METEVCQKGHDTQVENHCSKGKQNTLVLLSQRRSPCCHLDLMDVAELLICVRRGQHQHLTLL